MKNLENYGVQEMNAEEIRETDGGSIWVVLGVIASVIAIGAAIDAAAEEFIEGWNNPR